METQKEIWRSLQGLRIGSEREKWKVDEDAQKEFELDHRLCLVAKGINPDHQNPPGIKASLPGTWGLTGQLQSHVNEDGTVNFYFKKEHHLMTVLENAPYTYKGWLVILDRWSNRHKPEFLKFIPFWVRIDKLPQEYRYPRIVRSIGSMLGDVMDISITEPSVRYNKVAQVWFKVNFKVDHKIILVREVEVLSSEDSVELEFFYAGLIKFCTTCGSLQHSYEECPQAHTLSVERGSFMMTSNDPTVTAAERQEAIYGLNAEQETGQEAGQEAVGGSESTYQGIQIEPTLQQLGQGMSSKENINQNVSLGIEDTEMVGSDQGTKRKAEEAGMNESSLQSSKKKNDKHHEAAKGLVVSLKPPGPP